MYEIYLERAAEKDLRRLSSKYFFRIITHIKDLAQNPRPTGCCKISGSKKNDWRIRIGEYRVLYEIKEDKQLVRIMRVRHRRDIYRR